MTTFGYKIYTVYLTPPRKPQERITLDYPSWGGPGGALKLVSTIANDFLAAQQGAVDQGRKSYLEFTDVAVQSWGLVITASGGAFGDPADIVNVTDGTRSKLGEDDAVIRDARNLLLLPPEGTNGLLVVEARGRGTLAAPLLQRLNTALKGHGAKLRVESEVADDVAWNRFLDQQDTRVKSVELVQYRRTKDGSRLTKDAVIRGAYLRLAIEPGAGIQGKVKKAIGKLRQDRSAKLRLAGVVGLRQYDDDAFDEQRVVIVEGKRTRTLNVTHGWPSFVYSFQSKERPSETVDFLEEVRDAAEDTLDQLQVDRPATGWWPELP